MAFGLPVPTMTSNMNKMAEPNPKEFTASSLAEQPGASPTTAQDLEGQVHRGGSGEKDAVSAPKALGWLDRFLALWILLAMATGIILGNFVPSTGPALQRGKFVGVSVPIGMHLALQTAIYVLHELSNLLYSRWPPSHDVSDPLQDPVRVAPRAPDSALHVETDAL